MTMAYKNLSVTQAAVLAQTLGPEFTAAAKNDLINFADAEQSELKVEEPKVKTPAKGRSI